MNHLIKTYLTLIIAVIYILHAASLIAQPVGPHVNGALASSGSLYLAKFNPVLSFGSDPDSTISFLLAIPDTSLTPYLQVAKYCWLGKAFLEKGSFENAHNACLTSLTIDRSTTSNPNYQKDLAILGVIAGQQNQIADAEVWFQKALDTSQAGFPEYIFEREEVLFLYGRYFLDRNRGRKAKEWFEKTITYARNKGYLGYFGLAMVSAMRDQMNPATEYLEKAIEKGLPKQAIVKENFFVRIRTTKRFQEVMKMHFKTGWD
jgi:tetratricopeptide (TPR) repeat protein